MVLGAAALGAGCNDYSSGNAKHYVPIPADLVATMSEKGMSKHDPILLRSFKKEAEIEVWKRARDGKYALLKTYPICRWSGQLGPKVREGDRQAPEGFYHISARQMNSNSSYHLSFDMGYPNSYDRAYGRTGSFLMVHGACSSRGCYSMTDKQIEEIYALVREAHSGGQGAVQMQALPFRMTAENLAKHRYDKNLPFWKMLKEGTDHFDVTKTEPKVAVCSGRYTFNRDQGCDGQVPGELQTLVARKQANDQKDVAELIGKGAPAVRVTYADGGQHPSFRSTTLAYAGGSGFEERATTVPEPRRPVVAEVSRPEALEAGATEVRIGPDGKPVRESAKPVVVAAPAAKPVVAAAPAKPDVPADAKAEAKPAEPPPVTAITRVEKPAADEPFYRRIFSGFGLGAKKEEAAAETPSDLPKTAPLPPPRVSEQAKPAKAKPAPLKTSALPPLITGAQPALPPELTAYAPLTR
jgi:murein L,D-transpeptidase YafK